MKTYKYSLKEMKAIKDQFLGKEITLEGIKYLVYKVYRGYLYINNDGYIKRVSPEDVNII